MNTILPSQIEVFESPDGVHFRLPPPAGSWGDAVHDVSVTTDGKLRWQTDSNSTAAANELAVEDLARFVVSPFGHLAALAVETRQGTTQAVCIGYPRDWLGALAAELNRYCRVSADPASGSRPSPPAQPQTTTPQQTSPDVDACRPTGESMRALYEEVQTASARGPAFQEDPNQPPSSRVICQARNDGVTLIVPPGGRSLFFLLGCVLCIFAALPTLGGLMTGFRADDGSYWSLLTTAIFWAVALAVFLPAYHNAHAQVALAVVGQELEMLETSPVRSRRRSWNRAELIDIRCGDNGWVSGSDESNLTPVAQLHILPKGEKKVGLLTGRDTAEIRWIASVLRRALHLPHPSGDGLSRGRS